MDALFGKASAVANALPADDEGVHEPSEGDGTKLV